MEKVDEYYKEWASICRIFETKTHPPIHPHNHFLDFAECYHQSRSGELIVSNLKYKIQVLEEIAFMFTLQSDSSCSTNGYRSLLNRISCAKQLVEDVNKL